MCSRQSSSDDLDGAADSELTDYEADEAAREARALAVEEDTGTSSAEQPQRRRTPASERSRYKGDPALLADALAPYATSRSFVQYDECKNVAKVKIDPQKIKKLHPILNALREIHPKTHLHEKDGGGCNFVAGRSTWFRSQARAQSRFR